MHGYIRWRKKECLGWGGKLWFINWEKISTILRRNLWFSYVVQKHLLYVIQNYLLCVIQKRLFVRYLILRKIKMCIIFKILFFMSLRNTQPIWSSMWFSLNRKLKIFSDLRLSNKQKQSFFQCFYTKTKNCHQKKIVKFGIHEILKPKTIFCR